MNPRSDTPRHRGRLQVQGSDMNPSRSYRWANQRPVTQGRALAGLAQLRNQCTTNQRKCRAAAFSRADRLIRNGPVDAPLYHSFQDRNLSGLKSNARVDIEVIRGIAFA